MMEVHNYSVDTTIVESIANIAIETFGCLIFLSLMISALVNGDYKTRQEKLFLIVLALSFIQFSSDAVTWLLDTSPGQVERILCLVGNFFAFFSLGFVLYAYTLYICECIQENTRTKKSLARIALAVILVYSIVGIITQFNGMLYHVDENNIYHEGPFYTYAILTPAIMFFLDAILVVRHWKSLGLKNTIIISSYAYIPLITVIPHFLDFPLDIMSTNIGFTTSLIIIYTTYQSRESQQLQVDMANARTATMLSQIQPHFLYNALASINDLCEGNTTAQKAILTFSKYLRTNMDMPVQKDLISFEVELEHTRQYLWLEKLRFEERLNVEYNINAKAFSLPALTMQPIVENAVQHGITEKRNGGTIQITTEETEKAYMIIVSDDGAGFDVNKPKQDDRSHTGIDNTRMRIEIMCNGTLNIESTPGEGTTATITIPKREATLE